MENETCPCKRVKCERHGDCAACNLMYTNFLFCNTQRTFCFICPMMAASVNRGQVYSCQREVSSKYENAEALSW